MQNNHVSILPYQHCSTAYDSHQKTQCTGGARPALAGLRSWIVGGFYGLGSGKRLRTEPARTIILDNAKQSRINSAPINIFQPHMIFNKKHSVRAGPNHERTITAQLARPALAELGL